MVDYKNWIPRGMLAASGGGALVALVGVVICKISGAVQGVRLCALILFGVLFAAFGLFFLWATFAYRAFSYRGRRHLSKDIVEGVAAYVQLPQGGLGLDIGCGSGAWGRGHFLGPLGHIAQGPSVLVWTQPAQ